jgi:hypothetical protein
VAQRFGVFLIPLRVQWFTQKAWKCHLALIDQDGIDRAFRAKLKSGKKIVRLLSQDISTHLMA